VTDTRAEFVCACPTSTQIFVRGLAEADLNQRLNQSHHPKPEKFSSAGFFFQYSKLSNLEFEAAGKVPTGNLFIDAVVAIIFFTVL